MPIGGLIVHEVGTPGLEPLMDLNMTALSTGRERSLDEFESLFGRAGLTPTRTMASASLVSVLELVPAPPSPGAMGSVH